MVEWKATAAAYVDPELAAQLRDPIEGDFGALLAPEGADAISEGVAQLDAGQEVPGTEVLARFRRD